MTKSIVISGPPAVGKTTVAKGLARVFGLEHVSGGDVLKEMASRQGFDSSSDDWWDTDEGMKFLERREKNPEFDKKLDEKLIVLFNQGGMIITSYTLPWLVSGGIRIWLEGSHESSIKRMQRRDGMSPDVARTITRKRFDKNTALYKKIYNFDFGQDTSVFDSVINTDDLTAQQVIDAASKIVRKLL